LERAIARYSVVDASAFGALSQGVILETPLWPHGHFRLQRCRRHIEGHSRWRNLHGHRWPRWTRDARLSCCIVDGQKVRMGESVTGGNSIQLNAAVRANTLDTLVLLRNGER
jgi:hypothetical protein